MQTNISKISTEMKIGIICGIIGMSLLIVLILALYIRNIIRTSRKDTAGFAFEEQITRRLASYCKNSNYRYIKGEKFKYAGENFFEIDGFLMTNKFLIIVEIKYIIGELTGQASDKLISVINNGNTTRFTNPLIQNFRHIEHFYKMCGFKFPVLSLLILPNGSECNITHQGAWSVVANEDNFENVLLELDEELKDIPNISKDKIDDIFAAIKEHKVVSLKDIKKWNKGKK
ncbi:NERD domain-containing protein [Mycoplasma sp. ES3157-GEN-MYC]|uniref:NERD domain-containing protein n=1 Tax=Mycoplasma miroungigenitalium TaxID=754515 RepID=A0A6M4JG96_9MOLU|nr:nuclease-related domain-containing protein [Mycoplasma miroungigenitalium]MBU4690584.1 NERD domain-containing protein [Mycoplasma miroungigenitalium]MBU4691851.1 NERD domain-containing protein [Mycoplasma miroungigenitalium]QJR43711.1 NERD domain-containing protein [Mycoplasma miroungigenitalium]